MKLVNSILEGNIEPRRLSNSVSLLLSCVCLFHLGRPMLQSRKKKILIFTNSAWNILNFRKDLISYLRKNEFDIGILTPEDRFLKELKKSETDVTSIPLHRSRKNPFYEIMSLLIVYFAIRKARPDCVLTFTIKPNIYGALACRMLDVPIICNVSGLGSTFISQNWTTQLVRKLYRIAFKNAAQVFFQNNYDRQMFVDLSIVTSRGSQVIPGSGVDVDYFYPSKTKAQQQGTPTRFLFIGRLIREKGVFELLEAMRMVQKKHIDVDLVIIGEFDQDNPSAISPNEFDRLAIGIKLTYHGFQGDVRPFIDAADCVILPSYREGLSKTLLEAASMGKPLIASAVPGCQELIMPGENGFLANPRDANSLTEVIEQFLCLSPQQRADFGANSRRLVETKYHYNVINKLYLDQIATAIAVDGT